MMEKKFVKLSRKTAGCGSPGYYYAEGGRSFCNGTSSDGEFRKENAVFIVVSAVGQERITEDAFTLGADYYMLKPFDNQLLLNRIKHMRRGGLRQSRESAVRRLRRKIRRKCLEAWKTMSQTLYMKSASRHISRDISI